MYACKDVSLDLSFVSYIIYVPKIPFRYMDLFDEVLLTAFLSRIDFFLFL